MHNQRWLVVVTADGLGSIGAVGFAGREAGYRTCLVTNRRHHQHRFAAGGAYDDVLYVPDVYNVEPLWAALDPWVVGRNLAGILSCSDGVTATTAWIADKLGLPHPALSGLTNSADKHRGRMLERAAGLATPRFALVSSGADAASAVSHVGVPAVLKPVYGVASHLVQVIGEPDGLPAVVEAARRQLHDAFSGRYRDEAAGFPGGESPRDAFLLEEELIGTEYTADVVVRDGVVRPVLLVEKVAIGGDRINPPVAVWPPFDERPAETALVWRTVRAVIEAYGIDDTLANVDVVVRAGECFVLDVNAGRFGGRMINRLARLATGVRLDRELVAVHTGEPSPEPELPTLQDRVTMLSVRAAGDGRLALPPGLARFMARPDVVDSTAFYADGDHVKASGGRQVTVAALLMRAATPQDVLARYDELTSQTEIVVR